MCAQINLRGLGKKSIVAIEYVVYHLNQKVFLAPNESYGTKNCVRTYARTCVHIRTYTVISLWTLEKLFKILWFLVHWTIKRIKRTNRFYKKHQLVYHIFFRKHWLWTRNLLGFHGKTTNRSNQVKQRVLLPAHKIK